MFFFKCFFHKFFFLLKIFFLFGGRVLESLFFWGFCFFFLDFLVMALSSFPFANFQFVESPVFCPTGTKVF